MAQFLIKLQDAGHIDPEKDLQCYKRGDVVAVMPDDHVWGISECPPAFGVIKIPNFTVEEGKVYLEPEMGEYYSNLEKKIQLKPIRRRMRFFNLEKLSASSKDSIKGAPITIQKTEAFLVAEQKNPK